MPLSYANPKGEHGMPHLGRNSTESFPVFEPPKNNAWRPKVIHISHRTKKGLSTSGPRKRARVHRFQEDRAGEGDENEGSAT